MGPPLQYESLKEVLLHMDANTRFRISLHMPSIRNIEKMVPLRINHLALDDYKTQVNDTSYQVGIVRHFPDGNAPEIVNRLNDIGGVSTDFDEFGFETRWSSNMLPGDVSFERFGPIVEREQTERDEIFRKGLLRVHEKALELRTELESKGVDVEEYLNSLEPLPDDDNFQEENSIRRALGFSVEHLSVNIEHGKLELLPFECRRNKTKPPFTCYIQLTIEKRGIRQIQLFEYNKKLYEAVKDLNEVLFGGRTMPIQVENANLIACNGICRLPTGFRLQVQKAQVLPDLVSHESFPLLVENWDNLDRVWMFCSTELKYFQNTVVRGAKRIVIDGVMSDLDEVIRNLSNLEISIMPMPNANSSELFFSFIEAWLAGDRQVGASLWIELKNEEKARDALELTRTRYEGTAKSQRSITIHRSYSTNVEVCYDPVEGPSRGTWIMKTRIVKI